MVGIVAIRKLVLFLGLIASGLLSGLGLYYVVTRPVAFERPAWIGARTEEDWRLRSRMARRLVADHELLGKDRAQIAALLGEPEKYSDATNAQMYYLIREEWSGIDPVRRDHLLVSTDQNGRVVKIEIVVFRK